MRSGLSGAGLARPCQSSIRDCLRRIEHTLPVEGDADGHQLARLGASRRPGRAGGAAQAQGFRHRAEGGVGAGQRARRAAGLPGVGGAGRRTAVPAAALPPPGRGEGLGRRRDPGDVRRRRPGAQRDHDRHEQAVHRAQQRVGRSPRRGRAAVRHRARARPCDQRARGLPDAAAAAPLPDRRAELDPARRPRYPSDRRRPLRVVAQGRAVGRPGRAARDPGPRDRRPGAHATGERRPPRRPRPDVVLRAGAGVPRRAATCATRCSSCC